jgi:DNA-binding NarL/FixJ family response regulator
MEKLSKREKEVYHLIVKGLMNKQMAFDLGISDKTIATYKNRIRHKLNLETDNAVISHYYKERESRLIKAIKEHLDHTRFCLDKIL